MPSYSLPSVVDAATVATLMADLQRYRDERTPIVIDASSVERIGTAGLQLLWSASTTFAQEGLSFGLMDISPALQDANEQAGLPPLPLIHDFAEPA